MNRADIADFLGLTVQILSRTITFLCQSQQIALENSKSLIGLEKDALCDMAT